MEATPVKSDPEKPPCFGDAAHVCPRNKDGFIEPQAHCLKCPHVRPCLQIALQAEGTLKVETESVSMAETPLGRFLKRWSERKRASLRSAKGSKPA